MPIFKYLTNKYEREFEMIFETFLIENGQVNLEFFPQQQSDGLAV
jgi:hypothetical protein